MLPGQSKPFQERRHTHAEVIGIGTTPTKHHLRGILKQSRSIPMRSMSMDVSDDDETRALSMDVNKIGDQGGVGETGNQCWKTGDQTASNNEDRKQVMFVDGQKCNVSEVIPNNRRPRSSVEVWSNCPYFQGKGLENVRTRDGSLSKEGFEREPELVLCFIDPCCEMDFMDLLTERQVILGRCKTRKRYILGIILVQEDVSAQHVFVRYSTDQWDNMTDVQAKFVPNCESHEVSHFAFEIEFPKDAVEMEFTICCKSSSNESWDKNNGDNYKVQDIRKIIALEDDK